ncbi:MAG: heme peroxidase [Actinomycetota bacterium]|nr:heme peroxidase [Actinomycetota bacterium]
MSGYRNTPLWRIFNTAAQALDRWRGWHRLPTPLGALVLIGVRNILRQRNLYDTEHLPSKDVAPTPPWKPEYRTQRSHDGSYNDLGQPTMGRERSRFGRNIPLDKVIRDPAAQLLDPNPRTVSLELMTRHEFQPATTLNVLAAAWLQFLIKDWFNHGRGPSGNHWEVPLPEGDSFPQSPMLIPKNPPDPTRPEGDDGIVTFLNYDSPWWDGSEVYGTDPEVGQRVRTGTDGKLDVGADYRISYAHDPKADPRQVPGFWLGLSLLSRVFALEHNAICDRLKQVYPTWSDEQLFQRARLINAAVLAKIHTVEWTPALIAHPTTVLAMNANWYGLAGKRITELFGRLSSSEVISGIPGSETDHYGVPYSLTEEFATVYRMHPLIPDDWTFRSLADHSELERRPFRELTGPQVTPLEDRISLADLVYSFGHTHPGALRLFNFPRDMQNFERPDGARVDLAATDIVRSRELGVPRYNEFRRLLHLKPANSFEELTDVPEWAQALRRVYGDVEKVDVIPGMFAEPLPEGFAFSDTAFRVFIVMASRRLNSDRFFTRDFTPQVYTPVGMQWIRETDMSAVLLRHCPELWPALAGLPHAFAPFNAASSRAA